MREGDYGLHIKLITYTENSETGETSYGAYGLDFSATQNMFGNPYAFKIFSLQEIKYALSQWPKNTVGLQIYLYQNNNFKYYDDTHQNKLITYTPKQIESVALYDIRVSNVMIGFGAEVTNISSNKLKLYTSDIETYHSEDSLIDTRTMQLLWYNKSEDNVYIGFSDGIYDADYDEEEYLNTVRANTRLLQRRSNIYPEDELSLNLAADIYDIKAHGESAAKLVGTELRQLIQGFKDYTFGIAWDENPFSSLMGNFGVASQDISDATKNLNDYYDAVLQWAKDNKKSKPTIDNTVHDNLFNLLNKDNENSIIFQVDNLFSTALNVINTRYISYMSVYNTYFIRWENLKKSLENLYNEMVGTANGYDNIETLNGILNGTIILNTTPYVDQTTTDEFKQRWDNRYCIYWYRKDEAIVEPDRFMGAGWERLIFSKKNVGLPSKNNETGYCNSKTSNGAEINLRRRDAEHFIVVLFHNHKQITSNELIFENLDEVPNATIMDATGALYLEHGENSQDSYQLYGPTGLLINAADTQKRRQLRVRFNGESGGDEQLIGATVYWYVPNIVTMLEVFNSDIGTDFNTDRVDIYDNEELLNKAYDRGRLYANHTNLVGPDAITKKYLYYNINPQFKVYKDDIQHYKIYNLEGFITDNNLDINYKYVVKLHDDSLSHITYQVYTYQTETETWEPEGSSFTKFVYGDANSNYYTDLEWDTATSLNPSQEYIVGPHEGPFKYYKYNEDEKKWVETGLEIHDLTLSAINIADYKPGYSCYYRTIGEAEGSSIEKPLVEINHTLFPYHIKDYYQQTSTQNNILCVIKKNNLTYEASQHFSFSAFGNSGTDYTLALLPDPECPLVTNDTDLFVQTILYDFENKQLPLSGATYSWIGPTGYEQPTPQINDDGELIGCIIEKNNHGNCYNGILRCSIEDVEIEFSDTVKKSLTLQTDIPIPYGLNQNLYIEGASYIIYDSNGSNPQYYKKAYTLYNKLTNTVESDIIWELRHYNSRGAEITDPSVLKYQPTLDPITNILIPPPLYITPKTEQQGIYTVAIATRNGEVIWAQPIIVMQDTYSSALINKWDGGLSIDEENGTILSTMIGAGRKDEFNRFEGVLMGDVGTGGGIDQTTTVGLYGFHEGAQSFAFKVDGTAFLGKAGKGRIEFDGIESTITSMHFKNGGSGLCIDLDSDPYLEAHSKEGQILLYIGDEEYYLSSANYVSAMDATENEPADGMKINLQDGHVDAYNFKLTSSNILLDSAPEGDNDYFCIGNNTGNKLSYNKSGALDLMIDNQSVLKLSGNINYLQSTGYISSTDAEESGTSATGMRINLNDGLIDAYKFKLTSAGIKLNSAPNESEPNYFEVGGDNGKLIYDQDSNLKLTALNENNELTAVLGIGTDNCYLQSVNYDSNEQTGMTIDLEKGYIDAYNFKLTSSGILLDSNPQDTNGCYFKVGNFDNDSVLSYSKPNILKLSFQEKPILEMGSNVCYLQSSNYSSTSGMKIDLTDGYIDAYNFKLTSGNFILSNANIEITDIESKLYKWYNEEATGAIIFKDESNDFALTDTGQIFLQAGRIGDWKITSGSLIAGNGLGEDTSFHMYSHEGVEGTIAEHTASSTGSLWVLGIGSNFGVTNEGKLYCSGGRLGRWEIIDKSFLRNQIQEANTLDNLYQQSQSGLVFSTVKVNAASLSGANMWFDLADTTVAASVGVWHGHYASMYQMQEYEKSVGNGTKHLTTVILPGAINFQVGGSTPKQHSITAMASGMYLSGTWWGTEGEAITSYRDKKDNINSFTEAHERLFDNLQPRTYVYKEGSSNRRHYGLILDELGEALKLSNIPTQDCAAYCLHNIAEPMGSGGIRYIEFIPLNTWQIQKLKPRMTEAEERIYKLEQELAELKSKII